MSLTPAKSAYTLLFLAQLAIGAAALFARYALSGAGPIEVSALRLTIAAVPLFILSLVFCRKSVPTLKHEALFFLAGMFLAVHFGTWIASLQFTSVAVSTLLVSTAPVWTSLVDVLILKRKLSVNFWYALVAGGIGTILVVGGETAGMAPRAGLSGLGNVLAASGGLAFALYLLSVRSIAHLYPTIQVVGRTYSHAAIFLTVAAVIANESPPGTNLVCWGGIIGMAVISQMLGHTGLNASLQYFPTSTVAFSTLLEPIFAAILGSVFLSEGLSLQLVAGAIIVLAALAVVLREQTSEKA